MPPCVLWCPRTGDAASEDLAALAGKAAAAEEALGAAQARVADLEGEVAELEKEVRGGGGRGAVCVRGGGGATGKERGGAGVFW